ncbi:tyrosine-protein kinase family protein [Curvivirga sp.]|uniref:tyrosine-protein kinase family protein n=1 Tax=Curvivirga sp. TaxID=2856848 RepID=UPI003B59335C
MFQFPTGYSEVTQLYRQTIEQNLKLIAVASVDSENGASTLCQTLAERCAQTNCKTLLIDLNFAAPHFHKVYNVERVDWYPNQVESLPIKATKLDHLSILSMPTESSKRWEFRELESLRKFLDALREDFDIIIMDTSPLSSKNQGNVPPETICQCADGTLLSVLTGVNTETQIRDAYDLLKSADVNIHGAILNDRFTPSLLSELLRETRRIENFFPKLVKRLQDVLRNSTLLNQDI